ncbi:integrin alpha-PS4-like [Anticarsia gemmatalis]|uniref:integrin alpha-PS4-like n=1 Tax=Anticarsia gemmatalis TaxID=129554 RepID=UPI003F76382D
MKLIIILCATHVVWALKVDFYHEISAEQFQPSRTVRSNSLFGFSTTYDKYNDKLIIGAPRQNNIGEVYECEMSTHACSTLNNSITRTDFIKRYDQDFWFGATVKAGSSYVIACAPSYIRYVDGGPRTTGFCTKRYQHNTKFYDKRIVLEELKSKYPKHTHLERKMNTLGWSMDVAPDDSVIFGGPYMFDIKGLATMLTGRTPSQVVSISDEKRLASYNFGYGVVTGYFLDENVLTYAVGSPYGEQGEGGVYFYFFNNHDFEYPTTLRKQVDQEVVGSMFGAVLCAVKLSSTATGRPTDLLVGAPTYALNSGYNNGAVYVYAYSKIDERSMPKYKRTITNDKDGSFFGSAIVSVGDLNSDGIDEVAIGAPYEDNGLGAVYLYSGASLLDTERPLRRLQRIVPKGDFRSFGYSLSALPDYDKNGCNELAVGAPFKDRVIVYRCMAAITITKLYAEFPVLRNRTQTHQTDFQFNVCINVQYPEKPTDIVAKIETEVEMSHSDAKLTKPTKGDNIVTFQTPLQTKQPKYCHPVDFTLPQNGNYDLEIGYRITTRLLENPIERSKFEGNRVILNDRSVYTHTDEVWAADCSGNRECISNLTMKISSNMGHKFIAGSKDMGSFDIDVFNTGDVAYDPCLQVKVIGATIYSAPMGCSHKPGGVYECNSRKPLRTDDVWKTTTVQVDLRALTNKDKKITFDVTLFDRCKNKNNSHHGQHEVQLISDPSGIEIKGTNNVGDVIDVTVTNLLEGTQFAQVFEITNKGPTSFKDLTTQVKVEKRPFIFVKHINIETPTKRSKCETTEDNVVEMKFKCDIDDLPKQGTAKVSIPVYILPKTLTTDSLKQKNATVDSSISLKYESYIVHQNVTTIMQLKEAYIPLWIIIVAGLVGLFILFLLAFALYECGFLRRKNKQELKELKKTVKRQTMRRTTMSTTPVHHNDRASILEVTEGVDEVAVDCPPTFAASTSL